MLSQALLEMYREEGQEISVKNYDRDTFAKTFVYYINGTKRVAAITSITSKETLEGGSPEQTIYTLKDYRTYTNSLMRPV